MLPIYSVALVAFHPNLANKSYTLQRTIHISLDSVYGYEIRSTETATHWSDQPIGAKLFGNESGSQKYEKRGKMLGMTAKQLWTLC